jgi:Fur family transcriptional regulator, ferric uptake regulator
MQAAERSWSERATAALSEAGFRSGGGRRQVVDLLGTQGCAITALEIDKGLPEVGRATVYRALEQLEALGLIQRVDLGGDAAGYEPVDPGGHHHHHIVCEHCGRVIPFEDEGLEQAIVALAKRPDFNVSSHDVTLRGECADCERESA